MIVMIGFSVVRVSGVLAPPLGVGVGAGVGVGPVGVGLAESSSGLRRPKPLSMPSTATPAELRTPSRNITYSCPSPPPSCDPPDPGRHPDRHTPSRGTYPP